MDIKTGDIVKVRSHGERFWVIVTGQGDEGYTGTVNNNLIVAPYKFGDTIGFRAEEIIDVYREPKEGGSRE